MRSSMLAFLSLIYAIISMVLATERQTTTKPTTETTKTAGSFASSPLGIASAGVDQHNANAKVFVSAALGTMPTNGTVPRNEQQWLHHQHHTNDTVFGTTAHRRWRRGNKKSGGGTAQFPSLGSKSLRLSLSSKSGRHLLDNLLKEKEEADNGHGTEADKAQKTDKTGGGGIFQSPTFRVKGAMASSSRKTFEVTMKMANEHIMRLALEVVRAQSPDQMLKLKEVLKLALYCTQALKLVKYAMDEEIIRLNNAKQYEDEEIQQQYVAQLNERVEQLRAEKRKLKIEINQLISKAESNEPFTFAVYIHTKMNERHNPRALHELLINWERTKRCEWNCDQLRLWVRNHSTNEDKGSTNLFNEVHPLHIHAKLNHTNEQLARDVKHLLMVDAAFDREARDECQKMAFEVPLRNWAAIAQQMDDDEIKAYVVQPLNSLFIGLHVTFKKSINLGFEDVPQLGEETKNNKKIFKDMWHKFANLVKPYEKRDEKTHQKELEAKQQKCVWEMLSAMSREEREKAKECVKGSLFIQMFFHQVFSKETKEKIIETKANVESKKRDLEEAIKAHNEIHRSDGRNRKTRKSHRRRDRRSPSAAGDKDKEENENEDKANEEDVEDEEADVEEEEEEEEADVEEDEEEADVEEEEEEEADVEEDEDGHDGEDGHHDDEGYHDEDGDYYDEGHHDEDEHRPSPKNTEEWLEQVATMSMSASSNNFEQGGHMPPRGEEEEYHEEEEEYHDEEEEAQQHGFPVTSSTNVAREMPPPNLAQNEIEEQDEDEDGYFDEFPMPRTPPRNGLPVIEEEQSDDMFDSSSADHDDATHFWHSDRKAAKAAGGGGGPPMLQKCASQRRVEQKRAEFDQAQHELAMQQGVNQSKSLFRETYHRLRNSKRSKIDSKQHISDFYAFYQEINKSKIMQKNRFFQDQLNKILEAAKKKSGKKRMNDQEGFDALNEELEKRTRLLFAADPGQNFLRNMALLSMQMTAAEIRQCADPLRWFRGCDVRENHLTIEVNGSGVPAPVCSNCGDNERDSDTQATSTGGARTSFSSDVSVAVSQRSGASSSGSKRRGRGVQRTDSFDDSFAPTEPADSDNEFDMKHQRNVSPPGAGVPAIISGPTPDEVVAFVD
ncbi:hypothetical protein niasHS_001382 [Heterodera schachtii]|uniref:Uncharacterized protein n=1 Tax=Heterodera schachtii TaxID=97005 RepID=A0ABD2KDC0_HETSC